ncbi:hypothetical protein ACGFR8_31635 [Streptomyces brevispora]|uniref:hypothetical protein n=1 Tax=Streptomyces brevispora TaxID=887462 RepID=UPI00371A4DCF
MKTNPMHHDRQSRLLTSVAVGCIVFAMVLLLLLVAVLVGEAVDDEGGHRSGRCAPATCQPYGSSGTVPVPGTNDSRSSAQKPKQNAPAAKVPAAPKAPAAPPRISIRK